MGRSLKHGFTVIELLVVVASVGLLSTSFLPTENSAELKGKLTDMAVKAGKIVRAM